MVPQMRIAADLSTAWHLIRQGEKYDAPELKQTYGAAAAHGEIYDL
jgi:hypothetical protein